MMQGAEDEVALARYHGATRFLAGLGASCQVYLENLAECFPNQGALDTDQLYTFIEVGGSTSLEHRRRYLILSVHIHTYTSQPTSNTLCMQSVKNVSAAH